MARRACRSSLGLVTAMDHNITSNGPNFDNLIQLSDSITLNNSIWPIHVHVPVFAQTFHNYVTPSAGCKLRSSHIQFNILGPTFDLVLQLKHHEHMN